MPQSAPLAVYLHGLNTYGDELVHIGPLTFGSMSEAWKKKFDEHKIEFIAVEGIGFDSPIKQAERALAFLLAKNLSHENRPVHLIGHSVGGLCARALSKIWPTKNGVSSIITFGTPHLGAHVAEQGIDMHLKAPMLHRAFKAVGYDSIERTSSFLHFTSAEIEKFNAEHPVPKDVSCFSFICSVPRASLSLPYLLTYKKFHPAPCQESDGFIYCESQRWCEDRGPYKLDHFAQMGVHLHLRAGDRQRSRDEFVRLTTDVVEVIKNLNKDRNQPKKNL
ncbi:MAG: hypothetical protein V4692_02815 [Bdellovibrionota bacterium]